MNEKNENVGKDNTPEASQSALPPVRSPSRRRLIKLGAAGVPVVATLASSPALAWNCKNPSAWGSNVVASQKANASNVAREYETWYISNWKNCNGTNTSMGNPWAALKAKWSALPANFKDITLGNLRNVNAISQCPRNYGDSTKAYTLICSSDSFAVSILVAMLNCAVGPSQAIIKGCVSSSSGVNQLNAMALLQYTPPGGLTPWTETTIKKYLYENWIAR
jgi:hypothetical protein